MCMYRGQYSHNTSINYYNKCRIINNKKHNNKTYNKYSKYKIYNKIYNKNKCKNKKTNNKNNISEKSIDMMKKRSTKRNC